MSAGKLRALIFAHYFHPYVTSGVQRASRLYRYLREYGVETEVICDSGAGRQEELDGVYWVPGEGIEPAGWKLALARGLKRVLPYDERLTWVAHAVEAGMARVRARRPSVLVSTSPPVGAHLAAYLVQQKTGIPWLADFRDPILNNPARPRPWARGYDRWLESLVIGRAGLVTAVTDVMAEELNGRHRAGRVRVLWNGFDPAEAEGVAPTPAGSRHILLHAGMLYQMRHPWAILRAMERLVAGGRLDPARFCFRQVGPVEGLDELKADPGVARLMELGCLEADGVTVPRAEAQRQTRGAHSLLLIDILNQTQRGYTVPAKIFDMVQTGRPVLAVTDEGGPVDRILARCGTSVRLLRHGDSAERVEEVLMDLVSRVEESKAPSEWFLEQFDGRRQAQTMARWLEEMAGRERR